MRTRSGHVAAGVLDSSRLQASCSVFPLKGGEHGEHAVDARVPEHVGTRQEHGTHSASFEADLPILYEVAGGSVKT